jgi:hypothetical protein
MVKLYWGVLAVGVVWIFGSLPWLVVNGALCSQTSRVCTTPDRFRQQATLILTIDAVLLAAGVVSARKLRRRNR